MKTNKLIFSLLLASTPLIGQQTAQAAVAANGKIAYTVCDYNSNIGGSVCDIWVMEADGSNPVNLTNTPDLSESSPSWSGDGLKMAFTQDIGNFNANIWVMDADGSNPQQVTFKDQPDTYAWQGSPSMSPDGQKIAFMRHRPFSYMGDQTDIFVINTDGSGEMPITNIEPDSVPFDEIEPAWSPDGSKIAFAGVRFEQYTDPGTGQLIQGAQYEIVTVNPDGSGEQIVSAGTGTTSRTQFLEEDRAPAWSPDGTQILFMSQSQDPSCCGPWQIWKVNKDGSNDANLSNDASVNDMFPSWSPDGTQILFSRADGFGGSDIYVMPAPLATSAVAAALSVGAAATAQPLTNLGNAGDPAWAPETGGVSTVSLTIIKSGDGKGTVNSDPAGIRCGTICTADFEPNTRVTLTARPQLRSRFIGWSGACTGSRNPVCVVTLDASKTVTAKFRRF
ncbi:InlB B-repeat-containing protein [Methylosarcina fibrata]|uniref:InlB B-repeat-containing protein n=1 Tax=Methylosarcina fibrata TaxID=105972 RepID=UPI000364A284|nr:PD40 domain-containing protein [Methylosarcina fibrata]